MCRESKVRVPFCQTNSPVLDKSHKSLHSLLQFTHNQNGWLFIWFHSTNRLSDKFLQSYKQALELAHQLEDVVPFGQDSYFVVPNFCAKLS